MLSLVPLLLIAAAPDAAAPSQGMNRLQGEAIGAAASSTGGGTGADGSGVAATSAVARRVIGAAAAISYVAVAGSK